MRLLVFIFCLLCLAPFTHADCEIASVSFAPSQAHIREGVPFFPGTGQSGVQRHLIIKTNNDPACSNTSVYPVVFSSHARDRASTDPDIPLDNINGTKEFRILPLGNIAGQTEYGLSITLQTAEEKCYGHGYDDLKKLVKESIANGTGRQSDYDYLKSDPKNAPLYGFLFDDPASITTTTIPDTTTSVEGYVVSEYTAWTAKQIIYKKFNKADCGYYARAKLGTAFTPAELNERSIAQQQSADYTTGNSVFYMCSVSDYQYDLDREDQEVSDAISWSLFLPKQGVWGSIKGIFTGGNLRLLIEDIIDTGTARISRQTLENNFCEDNLHKWEVRNATANFNPGSADNNDPCVDGDQVIPGCYELLAPIPTLGRTVNFDGSTTEQPFALEQFFLSMINILIGAVSIMAVGALIYLGFMYMNARSFGNIPNLKKYKTRFIQVFYGIGIILSSYIILNTINPELLRLVPDLDPVTFVGDAAVAASLSQDGITFDLGNGTLPDPNRARPATIRLSGKQSSIKNDYEPALERALPGVSRGVKIFMTAHTYMEGFYPGTKSWRTNNPGNIGNTDSGGTKTYSTLEEGIKAQYNHFKKVVDGTSSSYRVGRRVRSPGGISDLKQAYPAIDFTFDGSLYQYLRIYATGARYNNTYLSVMMGFFKREGITITPYTKLSEIAAIK